MIFLQLLFTLRTVRIKQQKACVTACSMQMASPNIGSPEKAKEIPNACMLNQISVPHTMGGCPANLPLT